MKYLLLLLLTTQAWAVLTFNPAQKAAGITLTNSDQTAGGGGFRQYVYLTRSLPVASGGKWYFELNYNSGTQNQNYFVLHGRNSAPTQFDTIDLLNTEPNAHHRRSETLYRSNSGTIGSNAVAYAAGDRVMIAIDLDNMKIWVGANGAWGGSDDPATNTGGGDLTLGPNLSTYTDIYLLYSLYTANVTLIQDGAASYAAPSGFTYLDDTAGGGGAPPPAPNTFVPFPPSNPPANSITTKGGLLTSNGTNQVVKSACADTEIIEFDSTVTEGFKCVAKPVDTNAGTLCVAGEYLDGDGTCKTVPSGGSTLYTGSSSGTYTAPNLADNFANATSVTSVAGVVVTAGQVVRLSVNDIGNLTTKSLWYGSCIFYLSRNGTHIRTYSANTTSNAVTDFLAFSHVESPSAGTYTYDLRAISPTGGNLCNVRNYQIMAEVN